VIFPQDVLGLKLNRVTLVPDTAGLPPGASLLPQHQKKSYDVDDKDFFWEAAGALPFPKVRIWSATCKSAASW
jgi:hypothetical protein